MATKRQELIDKYQELLYGVGEYDVWDDEIWVKLPELSTAEIRRMYLEDKAWYENRKHMIAV